MSSSESPVAEVEASRGFRIACLALFGIALALRALHISQLGSAPFFDLELGDARSYADWARRIADGDWLGSGVFYQAPLYPYFLGVLYAVVGDDAWIVRGAQALLGAGACVLLAGAGRRFFSEGAGLIAGSLLAVYAPALFFDGLIQKASLGMFLLCLALWQLSRIEQRARAIRWGWLGVVLGALVLTRENALVIAVIVAFWLVVTYRGDARRWHFAAALLLGLAATLGPVTLRNALVGGEFHLTTSQLGPNFYIGNHREAPGVYVPLRRGRGDAKAEQGDARLLAEAELGRELTPGEVSSYWLSRSFTEIAEDPAGWLTLLARKFGMTWNAFEIGDTEFQEQHAEWSTPLRVTSRFAHFGVIAPLAVIGLFASFEKRRRIWLLYLLLAGYAASVGGFYVMARYRYPLVPVLMLFGGAGLVGAVPAWRSAPLAKRVSGIAVLLAVAVFCNLPADEEVAPRWVGDYNVATALLARGDTEAAIISLRHALDAQPDESLVRTQLGIAFLASGHNAAALGEFEAAIELDPEFLDARLGASRALVALGREPEALTQLRLAGEIAPASPLPLNDAAWLLATSARIDARTAKRALKMATRANELAGGDDLYVLDTLAAACAANGDFERASEIAQGVRERALEAGNRELAEAVSSRLEEYRGGRRFVANAGPVRESR